MAIDIGRGNVFTSLFDRRPLEYKYRWSHSVRVFLFTTIFLYVLPLVYCWRTQPSLFKSSSLLDMPFLLDFGAFTMVFIIMPLLIINVRTERRLINRTYERLFSGPLQNSWRKDESLALAAYYRKTNLWSLAICTLFSSFISYTWLATFLSDHRITWHTYGSMPGAERLNPIGWFCLFFMVGFFWLILSTTVIRIFFHFINFAAITKTHRVQVNPLHPDNCGGLSMISNLVKANQPIVLAIGLIIAGNYANDIIVLSKPIFSLPEISMLAGFVVLCILAFILPLLPYKSAMSETKYETLETISREFQKRWATEFGKLSHDEIDAMDTKSLRELKNIYDFAKQMPVWPFNIETVRSFVRFAIIPFLAMLLSTIYQKLIQSIIR